MAVEDELVTCTRCSGNGMVSGARCPVCVGRGMVRGGAHIDVELDTDVLESDDDPDGLDELELIHLRERAEALGLSTDGEREDIVARIRAGQEDAESIPSPEGGDELDGLTVAQLRERAVDLGLDPKGKKADIAGRIRAKVAEGAPA